MRAVCNTIPSSAYLYIIFALTVDPVQWDENKVLLWLDWATEEFGLNPINKSNWQISGIQLCAMSKEDFLERCSSNSGEVLHSHLNLLKAKGIIQA